jgi:hypothetical protein
MIPECKHAFGWARRADLDSRDVLRFTCRTCGCAGWKRLGEPDSAARPLTGPGIEHDRAERVDAFENARARRAAEDEGYHPFVVSPPTLPRGLGR